MWLAASMYLASNRKNSSSFHFLCVIFFYLVAQKHPSCQESLFTQKQILEFANQVEDTLFKKGARVALLARVGRPPKDLPKGMHFTHVGFAVRSENLNQRPRYTLFNLYQKEGHPDVSTLVQDFPEDFFKKVAVLEAGILIPSPHLQEKILSVIISPIYGLFHDSHYSLIANPYTLGRQNCTEFVLDVINSALYDTQDIAKIKQIEMSSFVGQTVHVHPIKLIAAALFSSEISICDHPGKAVTATFETIATYLEKVDPESYFFTKNW
ncbi:DUF2145 domain-containing protein [Gammaproteobacteria bacterium]